MSIRWINFLLSAALALLICTSCGSGAQAPAGAAQPQPDPDPPAAAAPAGLSGFPSPASLVTPLPARQAAAAPVYRRSGAASDPAIPAANTAAALDSAKLVFLPQWAGDSAAPGNLAYALYRFNLAGFNGDSALTFHWQRVGDMRDCFIGVADFTSNRWRFHPGADGTLDLSLAQWIRARHPDTKEVLVLVVLTGQRQWELASIEAGRPALTLRPVLISGAPPVGIAGRYMWLSCRLEQGLTADLVWEWQFGEAGRVVNGFEIIDTASVNLLCGSPGTYNCRVLLRSPAGEAVQAFTLVVRALEPPLITAVAGSPPPGPTLGPGGELADPTDPATGGYSTEERRLVVVNAGDHFDTLSWNFGPACEPRLSTSTGPLVTWGEPGVHTALVTATNAAGSHTFAFELAVEPVRPPQLAGVAAVKCTELIPRSIEALYPPLISNSGGPIVSWDWQFGSQFDPPASSASYPELRALEHGSFTCSVTAGNSAGSSTHHFTVNAAEVPLPQAYDVFIAPASINAGDTVTFYPHWMMSGYDDVFSWDFGGGCAPNASTSYQPVVEALAPGSYSCSYTITNIKGSSTHAFTLVVN